MVDRDARLFSYRTRGQRVAGRVCLGLGAVALVVALAAHWLFAFAGPEGIVTLRIVSGFVAAVLLFVGLSLAFQDREVAIDPTRRVLAIGWSWLRWRRMTLYPVEEDARILLEPLEVRAGRTTTTYFPVSYLHGAGTKEIVRGADYRLARRRAEALARSLGLPLVDRTSGSEVVRAPDALGRSVSDPASLPDGLRWPRLPTGTRLRARWERDRLRLSIPPPGFGGVTVFALLLLGFAATLAWLLTAFLASGPHGALAVSLGFALVGLVALLGYAGTQALAETLWRTRRLVVSPRGIARPRREGDEVTDLLQASAIEELDLTAGDHGVIARTDEADVELGAYLTPEEARCLRDMVHLALAGRTPGREGDGR